MNGADVYSYVTQQENKTEEKPKRTFLGMRGGGIIRKYTTPTERHQALLTGRRIQSTCAPASSVANVWTAAAMPSTTAAAAKVAGEKKTKKKKTTRR